MYICIQVLGVYSTIALSCSGPEANYIPESYSMTWLSSLFDVYFYSDICFQAVEQRRLEMNSATLWCIPRVETESRCDADILSIKEATLITDQCPYDIISI